jgi:hypothetical protein
MMVKRRFLNVGVFLVAAGAVMLVAQSGAIDREAVAQTLGLWPVVVIALGLGILLRRTRFGLPGGMLAAAMPGLLLGGLVVAAPQLAPGCGDVGPVSFATQQGTFGGAAAVDLTLACGDLAVTTAPGSGWLLQAGNGTGAVPTVSASVDRLSVASSNQRRPFGAFRGGDAWQLALPTAGRLDLAAEVDAGRGRFDLNGAQLGNLRLAVNAGEMRVDLTGATVAHLSMRVNAAAAWLRLPAAQDTIADLSVNAGALRICAPSEVGLRVHQAGVLSSITDTGLVRSGDTWESPGYSMASHHADVTITANVGSVDVNPMGGCQ